MSAISGIVKIIFEISNSMIDASDGKDLCSVFLEISVKEKLVKNYLRRREDFYRV